MSKFKVGDRVRRVKHTGEIMNCPVGFETKVGETIEDRGFWYKGQDGSLQTSYHPGDWELATPVSPVRTVTRKEIVPGVYGRVHVGGPDGTWAGRPILAALMPHDEPDHTPPFRAALNASELRAAAATFIELADALDEVAA